MKHGLIASINHDLICDILQNHKSWYFLRIFSASARNYTCHFVFATTSYQIVICLILFSMNTFLNKTVSAKCQKSVLHPNIFGQSVSLTQYVVLCVPLFQLASESLHDVVARQRSDFCSRGAIFYFQEQNWRRKSI